MRNASTLLITAPRDSALPDGWDVSWGDPSPFHRRSLRALREGFEAIADGLPLVDERARFGDLVHAADLAHEPVHRWYFYKEAFAPRLPGALLGLLGGGRSGHVADVFAGVGTTPLALRSDPRVTKVTAVEYSPFAHFVASTKVGSLALDGDQIRRLIPLALQFDDSQPDDPPTLSSFRNEAIFSPALLDGVLRARAHLDELVMTDAERAFFRLGLIASAEHLSGTIKDGRALRIVGYGHKKRQGIVPSQPLSPTGDLVRDELRSRWRAMADDLAASAAGSGRPVADLGLHRGDARCVVGTTPADPLRPGSVALFVGSPPYLNCIDYTEVYKLELWLLGFVSNQAEFRDVRLGTIRSHPSIEFPDRDWDTLPGGTKATEVIRETAAFIEANHARGAIGRIARQYFADMWRVLQQQYEALEPGGHTALVVGNSTFSRRSARSDGWQEYWRLPLLSDVLIARLGEAAGFCEPEIWTARDLRARNVTAGSARESIVVLRKPAV